MGIERDHEQTVAQHAEPSVDGRARAISEIVRKVAPILPEPAAGPCIQRPGVVVGPGHVKDAVKHEWGGLEPPTTSQITRLKSPLGRQAVNVLGRDLRQRAVALPAVVTGEGQPA